MGDQAHHHRGDQHVEDGAEGGAEQRGPADVDPGVLHPLGRHGCCLHADEGEQGHARSDADGAVETAAGGVEGSEVAALDEEPPDDADEEQGRNLSTTVMFWNQAIWRIPTRLMMASTHRPTMAIPSSPSR